MARPTGPRKSRRHALLVALAIIAGVVIYAYGFAVTNVDLSEIRSPSRLSQLTRVIRSLARPELLTYERVDTNTDVPFYMPCPPGGFTAPETDPYQRRVIVEPACVDPGADITVHGENFSPNARVTVYLVPPSNDLQFPLSQEIIADENGAFTAVLGTRERPSDQQQLIRSITREQTGTIFHPATVESIDPLTGAAVTVKSPRISEAAKITWDKILETVFLALLATTLGVFIAVPMSFFASRNLMQDIKIPLVKLGLQILALPVGAVLGVLAAGEARGLSEHLTSNLALLLVGVVVLPVLIAIAFRWSLPAVEDEPPSSGLRFARAGVLVVASVAGIVVMFLVGNLLTRFGTWSTPKLSSFGFLGAFSTTLGDIVSAIITLVTAFLAAAVFMSLAGRFANWLRTHAPDSLTRPLSLPLAAAAGAAVMLILGQGVSWLYRIDDPMKIIWIPGGVGALLGLGLAARVYRKETVSIGLTIYYGARTLFNGIRSIEPLVMVIVFVVWVGLGPFAGALALSLHTVAALAKLYSEQVESIMPGPIEAVQATGATRVQTIVYAVVPQIVPPYISFTLYRWDINVRMSTIIGFAGGGGIGSILQQNIRLLNYRAAAVNMLAIAIVVASMDYLSSRVRQRIV
ncbi:MAG: ABC transporter permease subunit [Acidimicrobiia bacterium]